MVLCALNHLVQLKVMLNFGKKITRSDSTQDLVFEILSREHPLSIAQINRLIRQRYNLKLTYQTIRKAILKMLKAEILVRDSKTVANQ